MSDVGRVALRCVAALLLCGLLGTPVDADVRLPHVIGSHMVLQRDAPIPIWGWAQPGEEVLVELANQRVYTTADADGRWETRLAPMNAGGPYQLIVEGENLLELEDVLIGEVWLCSGQSNMEMGVGVVRDGAQEIEAANYPQIRLFDVPKRLASRVEPDVDAEWRACTPETIAQGGWGGFSAVAYFFGREVYEDLRVPVGLIDASWGGSSIEPWTPLEAFAAAPALRHVRDEIDEMNRSYRESLGPALEELEAWIRETREALASNREWLPDAPKLPAHPFTLTEPKQWPWRPTGAYNAMIHPLAPFAVRGALWYQGESNLDDGLLYEDKLEALVSGWREVWGQGTFPFYFVQLAPFRYGDDGDPAAPYRLPEMWEAQRRALQIPNTGMVVTTDIGDLDDIHPTNKQEVGRRLALWARAQTYGRKRLVYSGPLFAGLEAEGNSLRVSFEHVGRGLRSTDGEPLRAFEIASEEGEYLPANAIVDGDDVLVFSEFVESPTKLRFAWHEQARPNLENQAGLPASPFRAELPRDEVGIVVDAGVARSATG
jgi:sialate O-acetylesterase